jgi:hypothetical protein
MNNSELKSDNIVSESLACDAEVQQDSLLLQGDSQWRSQNQRRYRKEKKLEELSLMAAANEERDS